MAEGVQKVKRVQFQYGAGKSSVTTTKNATIKFMKFSLLPKIGERTRVRPIDSSNSADWIPVRCTDIADIGPYFVYIVEPM